jgi:hypothetical protein
MKTPLIWTDHEEDYRMNFLCRAFGVVSLLFLMSCAATTASSIAGLSVRNSEPVPWPPESMAREWSFERDTQGRMTMTREWQYGSVDKRIRFVLSDDAIAPISGVNVYRNRHVRNMSDREMTYYWEFGGGRHAADRHRGGDSSQ